MPDEGDTGAGRRRDAEATKAALLDAARDLFGRHGFDHVTLRDIGNRAGVDGSLVARYFGSKGALHRAAVDEDTKQATADPALDVEVFIAEALRRADVRGAPGPLVQTLLTPGSHPEARGAAARDVRARVVEPLLDRLSAEQVPDAQLRAETLVACLMGVIALRPSGLFPRLTAASADEVESLLARFTGAVGGPADT